MHTSSPVKIKMQKGIKEKMTSKTKKKTRKTKRRTKKQDYKIGYCDYHLCEYHTKKKTKVYQCPYCGKWFCEKHIKPKPPHVVTSNKDFSEAYYEEWATDDGHPCPDYVDVWKEQEKKKEEEYEKALDKLAKIPKRSKRGVNERKYEKDDIIIPISQDTSIEQHKPKEAPKKLLKKQQMF